MEIRNAGIDPGGDNRSIPYSLHGIYFFDEYEYVSLERLSYYRTGEFSEGTDKSRFRVSFCTGNYDCLDRFQYGNTDCSGIFPCAWAECKRVKAGKSI